MNQPAAENTPVYDGRSVRDAVEAALRDQGIARDQAEVTVLDKGSRGLLGWRARPARVRVAPKTAAGHPLSVRALELLRLLGLEGSVSVRQAGRDLLVDFRTGDTDGLLIGRKGETLSALQHILSRMAGAVDPEIEHVRVDVAGYRARREAQVKEQALELAKRVVETGRRGMTEPLTPAERRIVHRALEGVTGVRTHVGGSGTNRRVVVTRRGQGKRD